MTALYDDGGQAPEPTAMTFEEYEKHKAACQHLIKLSDASRKLTESPEFKLIIMDLYMVQEPHRLGSLMASGKLTPKGFEGAIEDLRGIANLRNFLTDFIQKGTIARDELKNLQEAYDESVEATALNKP